MQTEINIVNKLGLHARAAAKLTQLASEFPCEVWMTHKKRRVNAKSIMGVMMLAAARGSTVLLECTGLHEEDAIKAIEKLVVQRFGEEE